MNKKNILLIIMVALLPVALGAEPLTLEDAVQLVLTANVDIIKTGRAADAALRDKEKSWNIYLPSFSSGLSLSMSDSLFLDGGNAGYTSDPWNLSASLSLQLPLNITSLRDLEQKNLDYESARLTGQELKARIIRDIQKNYYALLTYRRDVELKKNNWELAKARFNSVQQKFEKGLSSDLDLLRAQLSADNARLPYEKALADYAKNLRNFKRMIGIHRDREIELSTAIEIKEIDFVPEKWLARGVDSRFDIQRLLLSVETSRNQMTKNEQSNYLPGLSVSSSWGMGVNQVFTAESWDISKLTDSFRLGLSLSVPLNSYIPGSKNKLALQQGEEAHQNLLLDLELARQEAEDEIYSFASDLKIMQSNLLLQGKLVALSGKNYTRIQTSYSLGESTLLEVEDAQQSLLSAQLTQLNTQYQYLSTLIDLGYALNTDWHNF